MVIGKVNLEQEKINAVLVYHEYITNRLFILNGFVRRYVDPTYNAGYASFFTLEGKKIPDRRTVKYEEGVVYDSRVWFRSDTDDIKNKALKLLIESIDEKIEKDEKHLAKMRERKKFLEAVWEELS